MDKCFSTVGLSSLYFCFATETSSFTIDLWPSLMRHKHTPEAQTDTAKHSIVGQLCSVAN